VAEMLQCCEEGPQDARVTAVIVTDEGGAPPTGFTVRATDRWR
jgi:acylphosphatase